MRRLAEHPVAAWVLAAAALAIAAAGARPYAAGWNDGSRLAAVESLVDRGTLAIDDSVFCGTPRHLIDAGHLPYPADKPGLLLVGTLDKLSVHGHYYSHHPAVPSVLLAGAYRVLMMLGLPAPGDRPDVFAWVVTVLFSGLGYSVAVGCLWALGRRIGLAPGVRLLWLAAFALATYAPTYTRHANAHAALLGVAAGVCALLLRVSNAGAVRAAQPHPPGPPLPGGEGGDGMRAGAAPGSGVAVSQEGTMRGHPLPPRGRGPGGGVDHANPPSASRETPRTPWPTLLALGTLTGLGFNLDSGVSPPLVAFTLLAVALRFRRVGPVAAVTVAVLPWVAAGVGINYAVSGKLLPMAMYGEFFAWPGSPFSPENLTGFTRHGPLEQILYAGGMLVGKHGFWNHNLPLLLAVTGAWGALRRPFPGRAELLALLGWCAAGWGMYAVLSNNMGGQCCSVRWFVPFLAPGWWLLAEVLKHRPELRADLLALTAWGGVLAAVMWWGGPWLDHMVPGMWFAVAAALLTWGVVAYRRSRPATPPAAIPIPPPARRAA